MRTHLSSYLARTLAGDLAAFGTPPTDEALAGHIRAEQVSLVLGYSFGIMLANACNALVLAVALWQSPDRAFALVWAAAVSSAALFFGLQARAARRIAKPQFVSRRTMYRLVRNDEGYTPESFVSALRELQSALDRTWTPAISAARQH